MATEFVRTDRASITLACEAFRISQSCYRYEAKNDAENDLITDWLMRLTDNHRTWGFGLCFLYLRNVKGFRWNHKRVYRIYKALELNLRIKPRKRLVSEPRNLWLFRSDNGPEYISEAFKHWARASNIELRFTQPGNPQQNAYWSASTERCATSG
jgi:transposase InsO family protein